MMRTRNITWKLCLLFIPLLSAYFPLQAQSLEEGYKEEITLLNEKAKAGKYNTRYGLIIDYTIHSGKKRGFLLDLKTGKVVYSFLAAHGYGLGEAEGVPKGFSNKPGSGASSLGLAVTGRRDASRWGIKKKYWLKGLEPSNSNLEKRVVVLHSWYGIPDEEIYPKTIIQSEGCPTVSDKTLIYLDSLIRKQPNKSLLVLFKGGKE